MCRILIVDDQVIDIMEIEEALTSKGYAIAGTACSGEEAVTLATKIQPHLILMDIKMPGKIDGISAAEIINTQMDVPIVFLSGHSNRNYIERAKETGPSGYILKPVNSDQIAVAIEIALYSKRKNQQPDPNLPISKRQLRSAYPSLTKRETQIAGLIIQGMDTGEIALFFHSSPDTISWHRKNIRKKLGLTR